MMVAREPTDAHRRDRMPRGKRAHQLDFGIIYLRLARREFCAAAIAAATPRRFPRGISSRAARARETATTE